MNFHHILYNKYMTRKITTLIVESQQQFEDFFMINLHTWIGAQTTMAKNTQMALEKLNEPNEIDLILCRKNMKGEKVLELIKSFLESKGSNIPIICIGATESDTATTPIESALDIKAIIQASAKALNVTAKDMVEMVLPEYFPVAIQHFHLIDEPICNVYRQEEEDENQYKLYLPKFTQIPPAALKNYIAEGHTHLYIKKDQRLNFVNNINQEIASKLELKTLNQDEQISAVEMSQSLLQEKIARLGVTDETIELAQRNLKYMVQSSKKVSTLKGLLKRLLKNKAGYHFKHSQILMSVATHLMDQLDWGNEEQREKLQFIGFFHDISLQNSAQAQIHSDQELKESNLSPAEKELVKKHAQMSATIAAQYPNTPIGVEQIIKQHHGTTNGIGFSEHYSQNISPMAIVFILSEDFVDHLLKNPKEFNHKLKIQQMRKRYETQRFQKIIDALESLVI